MENRFIDNGVIIDAVEDFKKLGSWYANCLFRAISEGDELSQGVKSGLASIGVRITDILEAKEDENERVLIEMETAYNKGREKYEIEAERYKESTKNLEDRIKGYDTIIQSMQDRGGLHEEVLNTKNEVISSLKARIGQLTERLSKYENTADVEGSTLQTDAAPQADNVEASGENGILKGNNQITE